MRWRKLGLIVSPPSGEAVGAGSHAAVPICLPQDDRHVVVLYSVRDQQGRSRPHRVVFDTKSLTIVDRASGPLIDVGAPGTFDDSGVMPCWAVSDGDGWLVYYVGWNRAVTVPFQNAIGVAHIDREGRTWRRPFDGPIVARSRRDPFFVASCAVLADGPRWRMWYLSCRGWFQRDGVLTHRYHIRHMDSHDRIEWLAASTPAIDFGGPEEYAISRPSVLRIGSQWHMWYSTRGAAYRIGYATSADGVSWTRRDHDAGIAPADTGWDSEMICYPHVFEHRGAIYMAYNGNGYGATGIGLAILDSSLS